MEEIETTPFSQIKIPREAKVQVKDNILFITKWNWDFADCEKFQLECVEFVNKNRQLRIYIFCNHPHCFTLGRGNERGEDQLVDFDESLIKVLNYPTHKIHRGGGITFHYPGQWIFYPIQAIGEKYNLDDHMCWLLTSTKNVLRDHFGVKNALSAKKLMGIWVNKNKMASIGVGLKRFVSLHGLALNLIYDQNMFAELSKINPCGLNSEIYICLDKYLSSDYSGGNLLSEFHESFLKSIT